MKTKEVELKNNLKARLIIEQLDGDSSDTYIITAKDDSYVTVGKCNFNFVMEYARELPQAQREIYAKKHKIKVEYAPTKAFVEVSPKRLDFYKKEGDGIIIGNNVYTYHNTYCTLNRIEIRDARYHRVGLGSEMLGVVIKIASKYKCDKIDAFVHPFGEFKFSTLEFYNRNGFDIDKHSNATKQLKVNKSTPTM